MKTLTIANDNGKTTSAEILAGLLKLLGDTSARWTIEGWAAHLAASRHPIHAINSFLKHEHEFGAEGNLLWAAAFVATCARCADTGLSATAAASEINTRRAVRAAKAAA